MTRIYLSANPKHINNSGLTANSPKYAGEGRIDEILKSFWSNNVTNLEVRIAPGVYPTKGNGGYAWGTPAPPDGWPGWRCNEGWKIIGADRDKTILVITDVFSNPILNVGHKGNVAIATTNGRTNNVLVENLTIDCQGHILGASSSAIGGVILSGENSTIRNVRVTRAFGEKLECFALGVMTIGMNSANNLIEGCVIDDFYGTFGGTIIISNNNNNGVPPLTYSSGIVRDCYVDGSHIGYGGWGMKGVIFERCVSNNCVYGVNVDSIDNIGVVINNCKFLKSRSYGIVMSNCKFWQITNNVIEGPILFTTQTGWNVIRNNKIKVNNSSIHLHLFGQDPNNPNDRLLGPIITDETFSPITLERAEAKYGIISLPREGTY